MIVPYALKISKCFDIEIERYFKYQMPAELRQRFNNSPEVTFDIIEEHKKIIASNLRSKIVLERSLEQHALMCIDNSEDLREAKILARELHDDIECRMKRYASCLSHCSKNYREWLVEDYKIKLNLLIGKKIREAEVQKMPFMLIVGEEEEKNGTISIRRHGQEGRGNSTVTIDEFAKIVNEEISKTLKPFDV